MAKPSPPLPLSEAMRMCSNQVTGWCLDLYLSLLGGSPHWGPNIWSFEGWGEMGCRISAALPLLLSHSTPARPPTHSCRHLVIAQIVR